MLTDKEMERQREATRGMVAISIGDYKGALELRVSDEEIALVGENGQKFYRRKVTDFGLTITYDGLYILEDVILGAERRGFSRSTPSRIIEGVLSNLSSYISDTTKLTKN